MLTRRLALLTSVFALFGCGQSGEDPGALDHQLADAEADWDRSEVSDYLIAVTESPSAASNCRWVTEVHDTNVESRSSSDFDNQCQDWDLSVPRLHKLVEQWGTDVQATGGNLEVEWASNGAPVSIELGMPSDNDAASVNDSASVNGSASGNDAPSEGEGPSTSAGGLGTNSNRSLSVEFVDLTNDATATSLVRMDLAEAKVRWADAGISDYQLELYESLNYWSAGCSWLTSIVDGTPSEASISVSSSDSPSDSTTCGRGQGNTTEQLHARIAQMADELDRFSDPSFGEHRLEVKFDDLGVPTSIKFDLANGNDEELSLRIRFTNQS